MEEEGCCGCFVLLILLSPFIGSGWFIYDGYYIRDLPVEEIEAYGVQSSKIVSSSVLEYYDLELPNKGTEFAIMLSIDNASDYIIRQIYFSGNLTGPYDNTIHVSNHCFRDRSKDFRLIPDAVGENWCAVPLSGTGLTFIEYSSELHMRIAY